MLLLDKSLQQGIGVRALILTSSTKDQTRDFHLRSLTLSQHLQQGHDARTPTLHDLAEKGRLRVFTRSTRILVLNPSLSSSTLPADDISLARSWRERAPSPPTPHADSTSSYAYDPCHTPPSSPVNRDERDPWT